MNVLYRLVFAIDSHHYKLMFNVHCNDLIISLSRGIMVRQTTVHRQINVCQTLNKSFDICAKYMMVARQ